jgi:hypothetical protein
VVAHVTHCQRTLTPSADWPKDIVAKLCKEAQSSAQVQAIIQCTSSLYNKPLLGSATHVKFTQDEVIALCKSEGPTNPVLGCIRAAAATTSTSSSKSVLSAHMLTSICTNVGSDGPGRCLAQILNSNAIGYSPDIIRLICSLAEHGKARDTYEPGTAQRAPPAFVAPTKQILACLDHLKGALLSRTSEDVLYCASQPQTPASVKVVRFYSDETDTIQATAGARFSVWLQLYDQFDQKIVGGPNILKPRQQGSTAVDGWFCSIAINENNAQGAVLWGSRTNFTNINSGLVQFNNLVITQPGQIEIKVYYYLNHDQFSSPVATSKTSPKVSLAVFYVMVMENPLWVHTELCTFVFRQAATASYVSEAEYLATFPKVIGYFGAIYYPRLLACAPIFESWNVSLLVDTNPFASVSSASEQSVLQLDESLPATTDVNSSAFLFRVKYRQGIDAVWTGIDFPTIEMSFEERLGLYLDIDECAGQRARAVESRVENEEVNVCFTAKQLKRAYYRKSLLWHPDRWANMPMYSLPVQGAFELISEAYEGLQEQLKAATAVRTASSGGTRDRHDDVQPVYA